MLQILNIKRRTIQIFYSVLSSGIVVQRCIYAVPMQFARAIYLFLVCLYMKRFRVLLVVRLLFVDLPRPTRTYAENSPSLCPTMSSVMRTSW
jgi:hypothetical protein